MPRKLSDSQRKQLSVGKKTQTERPLPEYVTVSRLDIGTYVVISDTHEKVYSGNESQVHNWLGRHEYKRVLFAPGSWVLGTFKRAKETNNA